MLVAHTIIIDTDTGEIACDSEQELEADFDMNELSYTKAYDDALLYLRNSPEQCMKLINTLLFISRFSNEYGLYVDMSQRTRNQIKSLTGWENEGTIRNIISKLTKGNVLIRCDRGVYKFNPWLFGMGDWKRMRMLRAKVPHSLVRNRTLGSVLNGDAPYGEVAGDPVFQSEF